MRLNSQYCGWHLLRVRVDPGEELPERNTNSPTLLQCTFLTLLSSFRQVYGLFLSYHSYLDQQPDTTATTAPSLINPSM